MTTVVDAPTLTEQFSAVRDLTDELSARLSPEDQTPQSMPDTSPAKWHRAHTTWFFEEFVLRPLSGYRLFDPEFRYLFNSYYEAVGARHPRPERGLVTRPGAAEVGRYRDHVRDAVLAALAAGALDESAQTLVELGCHHEQQHQELLLMDVKHLFSTHHFGPSYVDRPADDLAAPRSSGWRSVGGGLVRVGADGPGFSYDNEGPSHLVHLGDFEISDRAVTNADYLAFIDDGGYDQAGPWLSDGWGRVQADGWRAPGYWQRGDDGTWTTFTLSGRRPVVPSEPVCHVSFYEADAFARWAGVRLPTEFEWEIGAASVADRRGEQLSPQRCHPAAAGDAMIGDVWEWTASAYLPYPGFVPAHGAVGEYNGKFMSDQHVLRGAAAVTPRGHERSTYRNFFPAGSRWAFSGFRLAR